MGQKCAQRLAMMLRSLDVDMMQLIFIYNSLCNKVDAHLQLGDRLSANYGGASSKYALNGCCLHNM